MNQLYYRIFHTPQSSMPIWNLQNPWDLGESPDSIWLSTNLHDLLRINKSQNKNLPKYYFQDFYEYHLLEDLFRQSFEIVQMPQRINVYGIREMQSELDIIMPPVKGSTVRSPALPIVQTKLLKDLESLGFRDYRTYPVRVYYISDYMDQFTGEQYDSNGMYIGPKSVIPNESDQRFEYNDDRFVILQLTQPALEFFKPLEAEEHFNHSDSDLKFRDDFDSLELPPLFRIKYKLPDLFCNAETKMVLEKYGSLAFIPGSQVHKDIRGNRLLS
jgi:hypothetical protein